MNKAIEKLSFWMLIMWTWVGYEEAGSLSDFDPPWMFYLVLFVWVLSGDQD